VSGSVSDSGLLKNIDIIDLTKEEGEDEEDEEKEDERSSGECPTKEVCAASPLPWKPVYHFKSPQLQETNPSISQVDHLCLADIITKEAKAVVLMNYLVDISFLIEQCPALKNPEMDVLLLHGSKGYYFGMRVCIYYIARHVVSNSNVHKQYDITGNTDTLNQTRRDLGVRYALIPLSCHKLLLYCEFVLYFSNTHLIFHRCGIGLSAKLTWVQSGLALIIAK
jgi:hypothetical protein